MRGRNLLNHRDEPAGAFFLGQSQFVKHSLIEELTKLHGGKEWLAHILIPVFEGDEVGKKDDVVLENTAEIGIAVGFEIDDGWWVSFWQ